MENKIHKLSEETRNKMSLSHLGKHHSEETKLKISEKIHNQISKFMREEN
jgi:hypothetical protein